MFKIHPGTFTTKTFWVGLGNVAAGGFLCYSGHTEAGLSMIGLGATAITGRDSIQKLIAALEPKQGG